MKRITLLRTTLAALIALSLMATAGCQYRRDDHHDDADHPDDHHDDHPVDHPDDNHPDDHHPDGDQNH